MKNINWLNNFVVVAAAICLLPLASVSEAYAFPCVLELSRSINAKNIVSWSHGRVWGGTICEQANIGRAWMVANFQQAEMLYDDSGQSTVFATIQRNGETAVSLHEPSEPSPLPHEPKHDLEPHEEPYSSLTTSLENQLEAIEATRTARAAHP